MDDLAVTIAITASFLVGMGIGCDGGRNEAYTEWHNAICHERFADSQTAADTLAVYRDDGFCFDHPEGRDTK